MNIKVRNGFMAIFFTSMLAFCIFLINDKNTKLGPAFDVYVKLEFARYVASAIGSLSLVCAVILTILKRRRYTGMFIYIFPGVLNAGLGLFGIIYFLFTKSNLVLHEFLINALLGVLIISDVCY